MPFQLGNKLGCKFQPGNTASSRENRESKRELEEHLGKFSRFKKRSRRRRNRRATRNTIYKTASRQPLSPNEP